MTNKALYIIALFLIISPFLCAQHTYIIVPGTWASGFPTVHFFRAALRNSIFSGIEKYLPASLQKRWYEPGGDFHEQFLASIKKTDPDAQVEVFYWSGKKSVKYREEAGIHLAEMIKQKNGSVTLIGHSYGATVGIIASQLLDKTSQKNTSGYKIKALYALGGPVDEENYFPNMNSVESFYNLYSTGDAIHSMLSRSAMTYSNKNTRITNLSVFIEQNNRAPGHSELRYPWMAPVLLQIKEDNRDRFLSAQYGIISVNERGRVAHKVDPDAENFAVRAQWISDQINNLA
jgi:hypothetical protein